VGNNPGQLRLELGDDKHARSRQGHGSRACYISGCRHPDCLQANANYMRQWRAHHPGYALNKRIADRPRRP
jgi:hypothetical protein